MRPLLAVLCALLTATAGSQPLPQDAGAAGVWHRLQKLRTTASVMHITAHPDDEQGGVLATLSRRDGVRVALLTLTRGEAGDNAIGPQLFDALGLIRTGELLAANRYYGVDEQYFTTAVDYGFSKRLDEAFDKWGRENVLRDVVRIIRTSRPSVLLSRFQGNERDGHGNHQAAGVIALEAFKAAGDPTKFPEQIAEGLRPWQPFKIFVGGIRENEDWTLRFDSGEFSTWMGDSYDNVARLGLSFQRSQNSGRYVASTGSVVSYFKRVGSRMAQPDKEETFFTNMGTNVGGLIEMANERVVPSREALEAVNRATARAIAPFNVDNPSAIVPLLLEGLRLTREVLAASDDAPEAAFLLRIKERQFQDAINAALGLQLTAMPQPETMAEAVEGQSFEVAVRLTNRGRIAIMPRSVDLIAAPRWRVTRPAAPFPGALASNTQLVRPFGVTLERGVPLSTRPYFSRAGLHESRYALRDPSQFGRPDSEPPLVAMAQYEIEGMTVEMRETVRRREPKPPYGDVIRELRNVPAIAVSMTPAHLIVPIGAQPRIEVEVSLLHNATTPTRGAVTLAIPQGWGAEPASRSFAFTRVGERASYRFMVTPVAAGAQRYSIEAVASADDGTQFREGYELIDSRDLDLRYLYRPAIAEARGVDVKTVPGLKVGYVMGIGDQVPQGLRQLGAEVTLLGERDLAAANLSAFDAIVTGTRAYAVRDDLKTYNRRLLDYVKDGGNMIVLYNTQELVPATDAPFPGQLPRTAEEVSEEDSPVEILAPEQQAFTWPNRITAADFDGWVEQRGSKFFTEWDTAYTPMISTFDKGQAPQRGGWLTAKHGKGTWTYFAYALHRQLPYGVPGAYRIAANLIALGRRP